MKKKSLSKLIATFLLSATVFLIIPKKAEAAWIFDKNGWWYSEGSSWSIGWKYINGKWYYFNSQGYMAHDTVIDGYYLNNNGEWIESYRIPTQATDGNTVNTSVSNVNSTTYIGQEKAKEIAFSHAGISSNELKYVKVFEDYEDGFKTYEVDFKYGNIEYEYEISALNGAILKYDRETEDKESNNSQGNSDTSSDIGIERAKQIAFNHADVASSSVKILNTGDDYENGTKVYEIDFKIGNIEYEYEINALNGSIIKFDKEYDD